MKLFEKIKEQSPFEPIVFPEGVKYGEKSLVGYGAKISASERPYEVYEQFKVNYSEYEALQIGDTVTIGEYNGAFGLEYSKAEV